MSHPVRVAIVNDYHLVVAGLARLLQPFGDRVSVVELDSGTVVQSEVDVILYDAFAQPRGADLPSAATLSSTGDPRLVVFTWDLDEEAEQATRAAGGCGIVSKASSAAELVSAIERVHDGELVFPGPDGRERSDASPEGRWPGQEHGLSQREAEVLALICQGLTNAEIAGRMFLGINTIKTYVRSAYRKIGALTRSQAVIWGLSHGFGPEERRVVPGAPRP